MKPRTKKIVLSLAIVAVVGNLYYWGVYSRVYNQSNTKQNTEISAGIDRMTVETIVDDLTSFPNRYAGTKANSSAVQYIRNSFQEFGLAPFYEDGYYQSFYGNYLKNSRYYMVSVDGTVENIIGKIKGIDSTKAVILSAHLDSFRSKGVLDNASGTAVLLTSAKALSHSFPEGNYPVDIIFAAYNAEESGLLGSKAFYEDIAQKYEEFYNINLDCVGAAGKSLAVKNEYDNSDLLYEKFLPYLDKHQIPYKDILYATNGFGDTTGTSDHEIFQENGHAAIIIGEDAIYDIVHTKRDNNIQLLDFSEMDRLTDAIVDFIISTDGEVF